MRAARLLGIAVLSQTILAAPVAMAGTPLLAHRAVYDLKLERSSSESGITSLTGRMVYELRGSACDGYTVNFRYVAQSDTSEDRRVTDQQTTTFEDGEANTFSFVTKSFVNQNLDSEIRGNVTREASALKVELLKPENRLLDLGPAQFPTQHMIDLIDRAKKGETFYETTLFDGSEDGDKVSITTVVLGKPSSAISSDPELPVLASIAEQKFWPVDIAYFDEQGAEGGEETPEYRISFKLYENGLTRDVEMDYGDFVISGQLVDLATFDPDTKDCAR